MPDSKDRRLTGTGVEESYGRRRTRRKSTSNSTTTTRASSGSKFCAGRIASFQGRPLGWLCRPNAWSVGTYSTRVHRRRIRQPNSFTLYHRTQPPPQSDHAYAPQLQHPLLSISSSADQRRSGNPRHNNQKVRPLPRAKETRCTLQQPAREQRLPT